MPMPWFNLDDGFDTHPKVRKAGNAAVGLFCRLGSHSAKHLTEGHIDAGVVRDYGTAATVRKLIAVGMLHPVGHGCPKCEQPAEGGYVMHDYLDYNRSRKQIEAARENGRRRQQKGRDRARDEQNVGESDAKLDANSRENEPSLPRNSHENDPRFEGGTPGQGYVSQRDTLEGATGVQSTPIQSEVLPSEVPPPYPPSDRPGSEVAPVSGRGEVQPLIAAMSARQMRVTWKFTPDEWIELRDAVRRVGVGPLVEHAERVWRTSRTTPFSAKYFLPGWTGLEPDTEFTGPRPVAPPSAAQSYLADMQAIAGELRQQRLGGTQ